MSSRLYVGLISGTSMDGADAALLELARGSTRVVHALTLSYPENLRSRVSEAIHQHASLNLQTAAQLDVLLGRHFAEASLRLLDEAGTLAQDVIAIGSHGQTICHAPDSKPPYTLQLGDANVIAQMTGIDVVADFRRRDLAAGGQGAPLAPLLHDSLLRSREQCRAVVNIGGIANITLLPTQADLPCSGFDSGPGNCLLDENCNTHLQQAFDLDGHWAAAGKVQDQALQLLLAEPFFALPGPKSSGREVFHSAWVERRLAGLQISPVDLQATLSQLTAETIGRAISKAQPNTQQVLVCGGGVHNTDLLNRLQNCLQPIAVNSTQSVGINPDWVEAHLFAWLAQQHVEQRQIDTRSITGAQHCYVPGALYRA